MPKRRYYDHRVKMLIILTKNPRLFPHLKIPLSTAKTWIRRGMPDVVTDEFLNISQKETLIKIAELNTEIEKNKSLLDVLVLTHKASGNSIQYKRFSSDVKKMILSIIDRAKDSVHLQLILTTINLSKQRQKLSVLISASRITQLPMQLK